MMATDASFRKLAAREIGQRACPGPERRRRAYSASLVEICVFFLFVVTAAGAFQPSRALADNCLSDGSGTTNCAGNPATFPSGGAIAVPGDTTLNVGGSGAPSALTGNIGPSGGVAGASLVIAPPKADDCCNFELLGCNGDNGSHSPNVRINFTGPSTAFQTTTSGANGIVAKSIGQAGGNGGYADASLTLVGKGGNGGSGGAGGSVTINVTGVGTITTSGDSQHAILALSAGGAGGNGGNAGNIISFGLCGQGGDGNNGGAPSDVKVTNFLNLTTNGSNTAGIWVQSVGASGGNGGHAEGNNLINVGGEGKAASSGGTVFVENNSVITTHADTAIGIFAQSIGGFAGSGGGGFGLGLSIGGNGSSAGNGGTVTVQTDGGSITTSGLGSTAIFAQSGGGGGGAGGGAVGVVGFGGSGGSGGSGQAVGVTNNAALTVNNNLASGIFAQSYGGGGGTAGFGAGLAGIGGGGGAASFSGAFNFAGGGNLKNTVGGGNGGNGGDVTVINKGSITTLGADSVAILAQSVGGGGGFEAFTVAQGIAAAGVQFELGSTGGAGGASGNATWTINAGAINTSGKLSDGVVAQAIGAGGGLAGFVSDGAQNPPLTGVQLGAQAGAGNGSTVTFNPVESSITTTGVGAAGLIAQSIGGGGGVAQAYGVSGAGPVTLGATGAASGDGRDVNVITQQTVSTSGAYAHGIVAQSIGGGGGLFQAFDANGNALRLQLQAGAGGGNGGNVSVTSNAAISTTGAGAHGIVAQSVAGGGGLGNGVAFVGGSSNAASPNTLINYTTLTTTSLINGMTITGAFGSEDVTNYGHLIGSVNLVGGPAQLPLPDHPGEVNTIENKPFHSNPSLFSGVFDSGASIILINSVAPPAADIFTNGGLISPGALLNVFTTNEGGNFVQTESPGAAAPSAIRQRPVVIMASTST